MKIQIGFRDEVKAAAEATGDGDVTWSGEGAAEASGVAGHYAADGARGEALLRLLLERLRGHWWAVQVED